MSAVTRERVEELRAIVRYQGTLRLSIISEQVSDEVEAALTRLLALEDALKEIKSIADDLSDIAITADERAKFYDYGVYMQHQPECLPPRGDQSCKCRRNQIYCNVDISLDEITDSVPYNPSYVSTLRKAITKLSALAALGGDT